MATKRKKTGKGRKVRKTVKVKRARSVSRRPKAKLRSSHKRIGVISKRPRRRIGATSKMKVNTKRIVDTAIDGVKVGGGLYAGMMADKLLPVENKVGRGLLVYAVGVGVALFAPTFGLGVCGAGVLTALDGATQGAATPERSAEKIRGIGRRRALVRTEGGQRRRVAMAAQTDSVNGVRSETILGVVDQVRRREVL